MTDQPKRPPASCGLTLLAFLIAVVGGCFFFVRYVRDAQVAALGPAVPRLVVAPVGSGALPASVKDHVGRRLEYLLGKASRSCDETPAGIVVGLPERLEPAQVERVRTALAIRGELQLRWVAEQGGTELRERGKSATVNVEPPLLDNASIAAVKRGKDYRNRPALEFVFTPEGAAKLAAETSKHVGRKLAIVLDGEVVTAPIVMTEIRERCIVEGGEKGFSEEEVLALLVALGHRDHYPVPVVVQDVPR